MNSVLTWTRYVTTTPQDPQPLPVRPYAPLTGHKTQSIPDAPKLPSGRPFGRDELTRGRSHLLREPLDGRRVIAGEDETRRPALERQAGDLLDPLVDGAVEESPARTGEPAVHVEQAPDLARIPPGRGSALVDERIEPWQALGS